VVDLVDLALRLLRGHVGGGAHRRAIHRHLPARLQAVARHQLARAKVLSPEDLRQAPVHHQHLPEVPDHDVVGLEVAVDDAPRVGKADGVAGLEEDLAQRD
jgi:hypothetical protein